MSAAHTPGPWHVNHDHGWLVVESRDESLYIQVEKGAGYKRMADARLIAAAPDGLDAAREALIALVAAPDSVAVQIARRKLNAFISKATGEAS